MQKNGNRTVLYLSFEGVFGIIENSIAEPEL